MKTLILLLTLISVGLLPTHAQIQFSNGGFEEWEVYQGFLKPVDWTTNQGSGLERITLSETSVNGQYSMQMMPSAFTAWQECSSIASTELNLDQPLGHNKSLYFYAKAQADNPDGYVFLKLKGFLISDDDYVGEFNWVRIEEIDAFQLFEIPLTAPETNKIDLSIIGSAANGAADGCHDQSIIWIDSIYIDERGATGTRNQILDANYKVFPNPADGFITIQGKIDHYKIFDNTGKLLQSGKLEDPTLQLPQPGFLILELQVGKQLVRKKIINHSN